MTPHKALLIAINFLYYMQKAITALLKVLKALENSDPFTKSISVTTKEPLMCFMTVF